MKQNKEQDNLRDCRTFGLTLLQFMGILIVVGVVATIVLRHYF